MKRTRILIAQDARVVDLISTALHDHELVVVNGTQMAEEQIKTSKFDLFVVGIHFDDSRAIDLVTFIRADKRHKHTPILVVRLLPTNLGESLRTTTAALIKTGIITDYLELEGKPDAEKILHDAVMPALPVKTQR